MPVRPRPRNRRTNHRQRYRPRQARTTLHGRRSRPGPVLTLLPDGVYVHTASREGLIAAGATGSDVNNAGTWTLTVTGVDGKLVLRHDKTYPDETWPVHFALKGDRVRFQLAVEFFDMRWRLDGATLDLNIVASDSRVADHSNDAYAHRILNAILGGKWTKSD